MNTLLRFWPIPAMFSLVLSFALPANAQDAPSSWGVIGSAVPKWKIPSELEVLAGLHFSEDDADIDKLDLRGGEFRIGIARGRTLSGDWGVSFVRRTYVDHDVLDATGRGCQGGSTPNGPLILECEQNLVDLHRRNVRLSGVEVHKFIPFATIARRVQIGLNLGGGFGTVDGQIDTETFRRTYRCTFPMGTLPPQFDPNFQFTEDYDPCDGATISNEQVVQTGATSEGVSRLLARDGSKMLPIGRVEIAGAVLLGPSFKIRVAGGLNYPGTNAVSVTGVYFFSGR